MRISNAFTRFPVDAIHAAIPLAISESREAEFQDFDTGEKNAGKIFFFLGLQPLNFCHNLRGGIDSPRRLISIRDETFKVFVLKKVCQVRGVRNDHTASPARSHGYKKQ